MIPLEIHHIIPNWSKIRRGFRWPGSQAVGAKSWTQPRPVAGMILGVESWGNPNGCPTMESTSASWGISFTHRLGYRTTIVGICRDESYYGFMYGFISPKKWNCGRHQNTLHGSWSSQAGPSAFGCRDPPMTQNRPLGASEGTQFAHIPNSSTRWVTVSVCQSRFFHKSCLVNLVRAPSYLDDWDYHWNAWNPEQQP